MLKRTALTTLALLTLLAACSSGTDEETEPSGSGGAGTGTGGAGSGGASSGGASSGGAGTGGAATGGAGTGGDAITGGAGTGGDAGTGGSASTESAGCGMEANEAKGSWVGTSVSVGGGNRDYDVHLPDGYDPSTAYPVIMLLHGCGSYTNNVPMENVAGDDAILLRGEGSRNDGCWMDGGDTADMDYIDAMIEDIKTRFCADTSRVFAVGYSSGSWVVNQLSCVRPNVFRGLASVTGGEPPLGDCTGDPSARIFIHDANDGTNLIAWSEDARDRMLETNECDDPPTTTPYDPNPCVSYNGCSEGYPLVWCETTGQQHGRQDGFAPGVFWDFFQSLDAPAAP
jgi:polyhydroxybutyrate depolymerase